MASTRRDRGIDQRSSRDKVVVALMVVVPTLLVLRLVWLPAIGSVTPPGAVLIRPDGYVAWVGDGTQIGLIDALTTWFGPPRL